MQPRKPEMPEKELNCFKRHGPIVKVSSDENVYRCCYK